MNDQVFNDLYRLTVEEKFEDGADPSKDLPDYIAFWEKIVPADETAPKPCPRASHSCVAYKNRYLVIIGGETDSLVQPNSESEAVSKTESIKKPKQEKKNGSGSDESNSGYSSLGDVWVFDTLQKIWFEIKPNFKVQSSATGKKLRKSFEPRMAHSSVITDQFITIFGGLNNDSVQRSLISNDLFVLSLDGLTNGILQSESTFKKKEELIKKQLASEFEHVKSLMQFVNEAP